MKRLSAEFLKLSMALRKKKIDKIFYISIEGEIFFSFDFFVAIYRQKILYCSVKKFFLKRGFKMSDCIFCKIANKEIETQFIFEDEQVVAFRDMNPQAPQHILIIPKKHFANIIEVDDKELAAHIFVDVVPKIAKIVGVDESGFRLVINTGNEGGQTVNHLHVHLLGGRSMQWPPG